MQCELGIVVAGDSLVRRFGRLCEWAEKIFIATAWGHLDCDASEVLLTYRRKLDTLVVGLDYHETDPEFLRAFRPWVASCSRGTFHPKIYLFTRGREYACLLGSSNFTHGGFGDNVEVNLSVTGGTHEAVFREMRDFVLNAKRAGRRLLPFEVDEYEGEYRRLGRLRRKLARYRPRRKIQDEAQRSAEAQARGSKPPMLFDATWEEYAGWIIRKDQRGERRHQILPHRDSSESYVGTAKRCRKLFQRSATLRRMSPRDAKYVAGFVDGSTLFGSTTSNGRFKAWVGRRPARLDSALRQIPLVGPVAPWREAAFWTAWGKLRSLGVGTASRLLAMKRPDLYLCVNNANRDRLAEVSGLSVTRLKEPEGYRDLHQMIWNSPWSRSPRPPRGAERDIWDCRVALLDCFVYER